MHPPLTGLGFLASAGFPEVFWYLLGHTQCNDRQPSGRSTFEPLTAPPACTPASPLLHCTSQQELPLLFLPWGGSSPIPCRTPAEPLQPALLWALPEMQDLSSEQVLFDSLVSGVCFKLIPFAEGNVMPGPLP